MKDITEVIIQKKTEDYTLILATFNTKGKDNTTTTSTEELIQLHKPKEGLDPDIWYYVKTGNIIEPGLNTEIDAHLRASRIAEVLK